MVLINFALYLIFFLSTLPFFAPIIIPYDSYCIILPLHQTHFDVVFINDLIHWNAKFSLLLFTKLNLVFVFISHI